MKGSVEKNGTTYRARWINTDGVRKSKSGFPTKKEAHLYLADRTREVRLGIVGEGLTFDDVAREMLDGHTASESQISKLDSMIRNHVTFGALPIRNVSPAIIMRWRTTLASDHIRYTATAAVKQVLGYAERMQYLEKNPARDVRNPQPKAPDITPFVSWDDLADLDAMLVSLPLVGVAIKKTYRNGTENKNASEFIDIRDFVVHYKSKTIEKAPRQTHVLTTATNRLCQIVLFDGNIHGMTVFVHHNGGHFSRSHRVNHQLCRVVIPKNDVNALICQFIRNHLHSRTTHTNTCAHWINTTIIGTDHNFCS
jgi:hypothetical protein